MSALFLHSPPAQTQEEEGRCKWYVTFRIPVMENLSCRPRGGQLFREFRCERCVLTVDSLEVRSITLSREFPLGPERDPAHPAGTLGLQPKPHPLSPFLLLPELSALHLLSWLHFIPALCPGNWGSPGESCPLLPREGSSRRFSSLSPFCFPLLPFAPLQQMKQQHSLFDSFIK